jgi:hypothetical protein
MSLSPRCPTVYRKKERIEKLAGPNLIVRYSAYDIVIGVIGTKIKLIQQLFLYSRHQTERFKVTDGFQTTRPPVPLCYAACFGVSALAWAPLSVL